MRGKKKPARVSHERWLVSYADFITLLFAFFVVLFASGQADKKKQAQLATSIQTAFAEMGVFESHPKPPMLTPAHGPNDVVSPALGAAPVAPVEREMDLVKRRLEETASKEIGSGVIAIHESSIGLVISLQEAGFFESGAAEIRASALPVLDRIAAFLPDFPLRIEGHSDDVPIRTSQFASNWELSSGRASRIARLLLHHPNVHPEQLSVAGYAEFHPVASNATVEGRARNRRVDIVILAPVH